MFLPTFFTINIWFFGAGQAVGGGGVPERDPGLPPPGGGVPRFALGRARGPAHSSQEGLHVQRSVRRSQRIIIAREEGPRLGEDHATQPEIGNERGSLGG